LMAAGRFDFLKRRKGRAAEVGRLGEEAAARFLWLRRGFRILERNYSNEAGEIDLIGEHRGYCVFIEVKTRSVNEDARVERDPLDSVNRHKRRSLRAAARIYLNSFLPARVPHRFDLVAVDLIDGRKAVVRQHKVGALDPLIEERRALGAVESP